MQGEVQGERAAASRLAVDADEPAVSAHDVIHDREPASARRVGNAGRNILKPEGPARQQGDLKDDPPQTCGVRDVDLQAAG